MALGENLKPLIPRKETTAETKVEQSHTDLTANGLQEKNAELAALIKTLDYAAIISESDAYGNITYVNEKFCQISKYSREEAIGKPHSILRHPDNPKSLFKEMWETIKAGNVFQGTFPNKAKDGTTYWVEATITPILDQNGQPVKYISVRFDVTQQKLLEAQNQAQLEEMRASEEELRQNMEEMASTQEDLARKKIESDALRAEFEARVSVLDKSALLSESDLYGNITYVNEKFCEVAKYTPDEVIGKPHSILRHPDNPKSLFKELWETIKAGKVFKGIYPNKAKDGSTYWVDATIAPILGSDGKPIKYIGVRFDITKTKEMEVEIQSQMENIRASEEELRQNMEEMTVTQEIIKRREIEISGQLAAINSAYAFVEFTPDGIITAANSIFLNLMGYNENEVRGRHHSIFVDAAYSASPAYKKFWDDLNQGLPQIAEIKRIGKLGKEVWLNATYTPVFDDRGKVIKVIKLATDITDFTLSFRALGVFLQELRNGNFDADIQLNSQNVRKDLAEMIESNLILRDTLKNILSEVNRVVNIAGKEGNLSERLQLSGVSGTWKELIDALNTLLQSIAEPVMEINTIVTAMSMGDLTKRFSKKAAGDIADMANALNIANKNLNELLKGIENTANVVLTSSIDMFKKSEAMTRSTIEVATAIQEMANGAQEQALRTDESSKLVEGILRSSNDMGRKSEIINKSAKQGQDNCQSGISTIQKVVESMGEITQNADITATSIDILTNRSEEISRTLNVISDIASQTNLLALNAAIEAARAGDAGRGFAVVAEEIRKLAEDSRKSAVEIDKVIKDVQKDTTQAAKAIEKMKASVQNGSSATQGAQAVFQEIFNSGKQTLELSEDILSATNQQKEAIGVVVRNIEKIVVVSEETATGTQEIASSSQDLNLAMTEIGNTTRQLSTIAEQLKKGVEKFKLV
jgi:methyl-accepting chemotaxis protein